MALSMFNSVEEFENWMEPATQKVVEYTGEHLKYLPFFFAVFAAIYFAAHIGWGMYGLKGRKKANLASCCMSLLHGSVTSASAAWQIYSHLPFSLDAPNNAAQDILMQFSTAYMLADEFLFLLPCTPDDYLFIFHHVVTVGYMLSSLFLRRGGLSCLILMFMGEITSPVQNTWFIGRDLRGTSKVANTVYELMSPPYTYIYLFVRSGVAPPLIAWFAWRLVTLGGPLPASVRYTWAFCAVLATTGSQIWSMKLFKGLQRHMAKGEPATEASGKAAQKEL
ncbi:hypothetical protein WJX72_009945 [[Myrmecia] bisecta]|uniref:TLC domain-containing protein n=1 Tax=[Myrmecia] bisecta TaxID=41462 RepID=A0AAW1PUF4_9CHLO